MSAEVPGLSEEKQFLAGLVSETVWGEVSEEEKKTLVGERRTMILNLGDDEATKLAGYLKELRVAANVEVQGDPAPKVLGQIFTKFEESRGKGNVGMGLVDLIAMPK